MKNKYTNQTKQHTVEELAHTAAKKKNRLRVLRIIISEKWRYEGIPELVTEMV